MKLTKELAQNISNRMMEIIPYNINIMNEKSIIIGSGDKKRLDTLHKGAIKALSNKKMVEIYEFDEGVRPGVNTPIFWGDTPIGVIGITGTPVEVKPFGELVRVTAELLINQEYAFNQKKTKEKLKEELLYELAYNTLIYSNNLIARSSSLGIDLSIPRIAVILNFQEIRTKSIKSIVWDILDKDEYKLTLSGSNILLFMKYNDLLYERIEKLLSLIKFNIYIGIGLQEITLGKSVKQAFNAIKIGKKLSFNTNIFNYKNLSFISTLSNFKGNSEYINWINKLQKQGKQTDLIKTFITYVNFNGELQTTAEELHIHRNTLNYRLEKIYELTNKNPKNLLDLLELYTAYIISKL